MKQRLINEAKQDAEMQREQSAEQGLEFKSVEDAIRFDAARTVVPPEIRERVLRAAGEERARHPWWKRWFRR